LFRISCLGFRIYKKLTKQIILKLQEVTPLNDLALPLEDDRCKKPKRVTSRHSVAQGNAWRITGFLLKSIPVWNILKWNRY
jgi:hypothetical protein